MKIKLAVLFILIIGVTVVFRLLNFDPFWYISFFAFNVGTIYGAYHTEINNYIRYNRILSISGLTIVLFVTILFGIRSVSLGLIPLGVVIPILILGSGKGIKILSFLGGISYEIYLTHGITVPVIEIFHPEWYAYVTIALLSSILLAYGLKAVNNVVMKILN